MKKNSCNGAKNAVSGVFDTVSAHPYLCAFALCLIIHFSTFAQEELIPANTLLAGSAVMLTAGIAAIILAYKKKRIPPAAAVLLSAAAIAAVFTFTGCCASGRRGLWAAAAGAAALAASGVLCVKCGYAKENPERLRSLIIIGTGFLVKLVYVFYTDISTMQNDVGAFTEGISDYEGHAGYIEYLMYNCRLPDFDVRTHWQFYHPPLHHAISAVWIYINQNIFGLDFTAARESLQILPLFYSMTIIISAYRLLRHFRLKGTALYAPLAVISLHPAFTFFSGAINNDALSVAFMMGACVAAVKWYEKPDMRNIIKIALCIGLGMMTKLAAALVALPVAYLFMNAFFMHFRKKWKELLRQYIGFGALCIPLALWYQIRNLIRFGVPLTYVQELGEDADQYIGGRSFLSRITDFSSYQFRSVFQQWAYRNESGELTGYNEFNPVTAILKNSIFSEGIGEGSFRISGLIVPLMNAFFVVNLIIAAAALILMIVICFRKTAANAQLKAFFIFFHIVMILNFYKMAADYPFTCTLNFRYITPTVITGALFCGLFLQSLQKSSETVKKTANTVAAVLAALFPAGAVWEITALCFP